MAIVLLASASPAAAAQAADRFDFFADLRGRLELDWDSRQADGSSRDDRLRVRGRARLGLSWKPAEKISLRLRLRTGSTDSHQSPHLTVADFSGGNADDFELGLDQWLLRVDQGSAWGWLGRGSFPFWKQNEFLWDDDATVAGVAGGWRKALSVGNFQLTGGYFTLPVGLESFTGSLAALQALYSRDAGPLGLTTTVGIYRLGADRDDPDARRLLSGNGLRDYAIWNASVRTEAVAGRRPFALGLDLFHNSESYRSNDPDPFTAANRDHTNGWVLSAAWGEIDREDSWELAWTSARIEPLALHASYSQDDWVRWGSVDETRSSNLKGHELRVAWVLLRSFSDAAARSGRPSLYLEARLFVVQSVVGREDGNRFRLDLNARF